MKFQLLFVICIWGGLFYSCQKCELLEQDITHPQKSCEGVFYMIKAAPFLDTFFTLHEFNKPIPEPLVPALTGGPFVVPVPFAYHRSNFSAFDSTARRYVFQHYFTTGSQFFSFELGTGLSTRTPGPRIDVCPVFHRHKLYSILTEQLSANDWLYNIVEIDPVTGQGIIVVAGDDITTNSPMTTDDMSSVSSGGDFIYFLSGTNLIELNLATSTPRQIDIDPTFNPNIYVQYFGLEYKSDEGKLLCMKNTYDDFGLLQTKLLSIDISGPAPVLTVVFDISAAMPGSTSGVINPEFYSTAFDPCDNTYCVTTLSGPDMNTYFLEINLSKSEMKFRTLEGYGYGLEYEPKQ